MSGAAVVVVTQQSMGRVIEQDERVLIASVARVGAEVNGVAARHGKLVEIAVADVEMRALYRVTASNPIRLREVVIRLGL